MSTRMGTEDGTFFIHIFHFLAVLLNLHWMDKKNPLRGTVEPRVNSMKLILSMLYFCHSGWFYYSYLYLSFKKRRITFSESGLN